MILLIVLILLAGCGEPGASGGFGGGNADRTERPVAALDDAGREVRLPRPARRIVSLLPAGTETLFALGAGDRVVGRTRYDTDEAVAHLPSVGGGLDPSLEALVALEPDLVVAWESPGDTRLRTRLERLGIPVFAISTRDTVAILRNIRNLGHLAGQDAGADSLLASIRTDLAAVAASVPPGSRPTVLYVVSVDPPMIAGTDNFLAELIEVAGGVPTPISAELVGRSPQLSLEELVRTQPDGIVLPVGVDPAAAVARLSREAGWRELHAVREGRVATVPANLVNRPGPRIAETAAALRAGLASWERP